MKRNWFNVQIFRFCCSSNCDQSLVACSLRPGVAEAVVGAEQRRYVRVLGGEGGVVSYDALDQVLVRRYAGRLGQVLGRKT